MKKIYTLLIFVALIFIANKNFSQTTNGFCNTSEQFCTGTTYNFPAGVNTASAESGPNYMCLGSEPNPVWYYLLIDQPGNISIDIHTVPQHDVDFICWGPFVNPINPCQSSLTSIGSPGSHWASTNPHPGNLGGYPAGNAIDCSYNSSWQEWCYIPNAQAGEYYIFLITNYSNQPCNIILNQVNAGQAGAGTTVCGHIGLVQGKEYWDLNNNAIQDSTENGISQGFVGGTSCVFQSLTNNTGYYNGYICSLPDTFKSYISYQHPYTISNPPYYIISSGATSNVDFAVSLIPNIYDISTTLTNYTPARPGFDYQAMLTVSNIGTEQDCGTLTLNYDSIFDYISSNPPADIITNNTLTWNNICLSVLQSSNFNLIFHLDSTVSLSIPYTFNSNFISLQNDTNIVNNSDTITNITVGSYDPNDKQVSPSGEISNIAAAAEQELEYTIRFQNTGTYQATTVKISDVLSGWLQIPTFTILSSSHPCTYTITEQGVIQIIFNNINLPDVNTNELGSHGFVKFKVKCKPSLANGGNVYNTANIYFDYNPAIVTNTTLTFTKVITTNIPSIKKQATKSISIEPNPAIDIVTVNFDYAGKEALSIEIINNLGKIVQKQLVQNNQKTVNLNVSNLTSGTYTIHIFGKNYSVNEMLIKQ